MVEDRKKLFSVIIIYYNSEKYVRQSVESVLNQTCDEYELILVDDGSKDNTGFLCDEYAQNYECVKVIHKENGGIADARNTGIKNAVGEYVLLIDGDDYIAEDGLEGFKIKIEQSKHKVDYVFGKMLYFDDLSGKVYKTQMNLAEDILNGVNGREAFIKMYRTHGFISMGVRGAFRRQFLVDNGIESPNIFFEDVNVIMNVLLKADSVMINPKDYYFFRDSSSSTSKQYKLLYPKDIINEMERWSSEVINNSEYSFEFQKCVGEEIRRRIRLTIRKYATLLSLKEVKELAGFMKTKIYLLQNINFVEKWIISTIFGLYVIRIWEKVKKRIRKILNYE